MSLPPTHQPDQSRSTSRGAPGWEILALICAAQFMVILDVSIVNVALPSIREDLGFSQNGLAWVVNAYTLTFGGLLLLGGRAGDLLGRRRMFVSGLVLFTVASLLGGLATSKETLIAARALQGVGGAIVAPSTLALLMTSFREGPERHRALALWGAIAGIGGSVGALVGGLLVDALDWRWILFINVPIGAVIVWRSMVDIPRDRPAEPATLASFDLAGALTATLGLVLLVLGIVRTETEGWTSTATVLTLAAAVVLLAAFAAVELRAQRPLVRFSIFRTRSVASANIAVFLFGTAMFAMWFFLSLYMQQVLGFSAIETGLAFLPLSAFLSFGASRAGKLVARIGIRATLTAGFTITAVGLALLTGIDADGSYLGDVLLPSLVLGAGMGLCLVPITTAAVSGVPRHEAGLASGLVNVSRQVGGALGLAILSTIAANSTAGALDGSAAPGSAEMREALTVGYSHAFGWSAAFVLVGALSVIALVRDTPKAAHEPATGELEVAA